MTRYRERMLSPDAIIVVIVGYLLGSIPFGVILTRAFGAGDLRTIGSGSIGATNVLRTGRKGLAAATLFLDAAKGAVAVFIAAQIAPGHEAAAALAAFIGHCYPVWLKFRGGKGVATALGIVLAMQAFVIALICGVVWAVVLAVFRISSVSSLAAVTAAPVAALAFGETALLPLLIALTVLIFWKHRANIQRLFAGTEPRVGQKS
jgi:acyl phosphate:glycerol-3-phosphate acyltransferase